MLQMKQLIKLKIPLKISQTNDAKKAESANQRVTQRSTRGASTRESISNKPNVYVVSAKSTKFRQKESVENFQWLLDCDKIILELKDQPAPTENIYIVLKEYQDYTFWNSITESFINCSSQLTIMRDIVQTNFTHLPSQYLKINSLFNKRIDLDYQDSLAHFLWPPDGPFDR